MSDYSETSLFCARCGEYRLHRREEMNMVVAVLLAIFTCLIGFFIWLIIQAFTRRPWRCSGCGLEYDETASRRAWLEKHPEEAARIAAADEARRAATEERARTAPPPRKLSKTGRWLIIGGAALGLVALVGVIVLAVAVGGKKPAVATVGGDRPALETGQAPSPVPADPAARAARIRRSLGRTELGALLRSHSYHCDRVEHVVANAPAGWTVTCAPGYVFQIDFDADGGLLVTGTTMK